MTSRLAGSEMGDAAKGHSDKFGTILQVIELYEYLALDTSCCERGFALFNESDHHSWQESIVIDHCRPHHENLLSLP